MISEKAVVSPKAKIGKGVTIYPFAYIEKDVEIDNDCVIYPFVSIMRGTVLGKRNTVYQGTVVGAEPQDFNYSGDMTRVEIGNDNVIRENVVINRATYKDGVTRIGNNNFILEGVHISHDTNVCDRCVFGYGTKIAGDCEIHDGTILSSNVIVNPGVRVGICCDGEQRMPCQQGRAAIHRCKRESCGIWRAEPAGAVGTRRG